MQERSGKRMGMLDKVLVFLGLKRAAVERTNNVAKRTGNTLGFFGMLRAAGQFVLNMFNAGTTAAGPGPQSLILPFIICIYGCTEKKGEY